MKKARDKRLVNIRRRFIVAKPDEAGVGYSWTLAAVLGEILLMAEEKFGPRDPSYTLLGIDFAPDGGKTWFPGDCGHIIVHLDMNCLTDRQDAYRQLAHECIHLLSPTGTRDANVLEEGLAVWFEQWYMNWCFGEGWWSGEVNIASYANALAKTRQLLTYDPDLIKKIRVHQPIISRITADQITQQCPQISQELATDLTKRFEV